MAISFLFTFSNVPYPASVSVSAQTVFLKLHNFPCEFQITQQCVQSLSYEIGFQYPHTQLSYSSATRVLFIEISVFPTVLLNQTPINRVKAQLDQAFLLSNYHTSLVSDPLHALVASLSQHYSLSVKTLTHFSSELELTTASGRKISICTAAQILKSGQGPSLQFTTNPKLLTLESIEFFSQLDVKLELCSILSSVCCSAELQLALEAALRELSFNTYSEGTYRAAGFNCLATGLNEIRLYYKQHYGVSLCVNIEEDSFTIVDLSIYGKLEPIPLFRDSLHHIFSVLTKDNPRYKKMGNPIELSAYATHNVVQMLDYHLLKSALKMLLNYLQLFSIIAATVAKYNHFVRGFGNEAYEKLRLEPKLACNFNFSALSKCNFDGQLMLAKDPADPLIYRLKFNIQILKHVESRKEQLHKIKSIYEQYYESVISKYCLISRTVLFQFINSLSFAISFQSYFFEVMELELRAQTIEILWSTTSFKEHSLEFLVRIWKDSHFVDVSFSQIRTEEGFRIESGNLKPEFLARVPQETLRISTILATLQSSSLEDIKHQLKAH